VSRHLLDLAVQREPGRYRGTEIIVPVSQQELADAVGPVREVVVRVLRELRQVRPAGSSGRSWCDRPVR
jgi:CRP/FNR family cyclic AMP-dependent transcriptional regulator